MSERTQYDMEVKRRLEQAEENTRFRAEPIPATTMLPMFEKQEREKEALRAKRVEKRFQWLQAQADPPSCYGIKIRQEPEAGGRRPLATRR